MLTGWREERRGVEVEDGGGCQVMGREQDG
jgi:hypothetical protein